MLPKELMYPEFMPNQVLQSGHLNALFEYLDEQNRLTRTNLLGIGVVCGLEVVPAGSGQIRITKGCGVTSEGYLVTLGEQNGVISDVTYSSRRNYTVPERLEYAPFYDAAAKANRFEMWELLEATSAPDPAPPGFALLDSAFLNPASSGQKKVVLVFVELLENISKNCSPNSCDDKGATVNVRFRPLLIKKSDADILLAEAAAIGPGSIGPNGTFGLPDMKLPRFNVPKTDIHTAADIEEAYRDILTFGWIENTVKKNLGDAYTLFSGFLSGIINTIPGFNPVYDLGKVRLDKTYLYQYFYDLISDLTEWYRELQSAAQEVLPVCCPDERLFPRHLFLGLASENTVQQNSSYRHYFIPSPILNRGKEKVEEIRSLFRKLMEMLRPGVYRVPQPPSASAGINLRITPSKLGDFSLSEKAIPYYYDHSAGSNPLYRSWNYPKTRNGKANHNLSHTVSGYTPAPPDFVSSPLRYDVEPDNFFRIEGHAGLNFREALQHITEIRDNNRLPFDVISIQTGNINKNTIDISEHDCYFKDLEISYDVARREWECIIGKTIEYLDDHFLNGNIQNISSTIYNKLKYNLILKLVRSKEFMVNDLPEFVQDYNLFMPLFEAIEAESTEIRNRLHEMLTDGRAKDRPFVEDLIDHLDDVILSCKKGPFRALYQEFTRRFEKLREQLSLNAYANTHVGLQHKAGVPVGGTFIVVYELDGPVQQPKGSGRRRGEKRIPLIPDGKVIADFYLPYLCCSDCCGGQVIVLPPDQPPAEPKDAPVIREEEGKCDENGNYLAPVVIEKGEPPFRVFKDGVIENPALNATGFVLSYPSATTSRVKVTDKNGLESNELIINARSCCDLPCDGNMLTCEYYFPGREAEDKKVIVIVEDIYFEGSDLTKKPVSIDLKNLKFMLLNAEVKSGELKQFREAFADKISEVLKVHNVPEGVWSFKSSDNDKEMSAVYISYFECHKFSLRVRVLINGENEEFELIYNTDGVTQLVKGIPPVFIPKFNCVRENRCAGTVVRFCESGVEIRGIAMQKHENFVLSFNVQPAFPGAAFLWKFTDPDQGNKFSPEITNNGSPQIIYQRDTKRVLAEVWVFRNGCMGYRQQTFII